MCYLSTYREINSMHIVGFTSILDHPNAPSTANIQRSWLYYSGYILEPVCDEYNKVKIYYLVHADLRIPNLQPAIKNKLLEKHTLSLIKLKQALDELEPEIEKHTLSSLKLNEPVQMNESSLFGIGNVDDQSLDLDMMIPQIKTNESEANNKPNLLMWSLTNTENSDKSISDYITMGNSATASLFREYINLLEALRFSTTSPERFNWKVIQAQQGVWIMEKTGSTMQCMAGVANINASETEITNFLKYPRNRFTFDSTLHKTYVVEEINEDLNIIYSQYKAKHCFIGHGREFLYFQYIRKEGDKRILAHASCSHPKVPVNDEIIRGTMYETGFIIEPLGDSESCSITYIVKVELNGSIPESLLRWIKRRQPKILIGIKQYFEK